MLTIHTMLSKRIPEMEIDKAEANALATAVAEVNKFYNVPMSPELMAWTGLFMCAGSIYGPRFAAIKMRRAFEAGMVEPGPNAPEAEAARPASRQGKPDPFRKPEEPLKPDPFTQLGLHMSGETH